MYQDWMEYIPIIGPIMQKCPHCGMKIEAKEIFCTYCGEKIDWKTLKIGADAK